LIHLTLDPEVIFRRIGHRNERPLLQTKDPRRTLEILFRSRERLYATYGTLTIDRSELDVVGTVEKVMALVDSCTMRGQATGGAERA
jgi:shikimate kinase